LPISLGFYEKLLHQFHFDKKFQTQTVSTKNLLKTLSYKKAARKMLAKMTLVVNFTSSLQAAFLPISFHHKITNPNCKHIKGL